MVLLGHGLTGSWSYWVMGVFYVWVVAGYQYSIKLSSYLHKSQDVSLTIIVLLFPMYTSSVSSYRPWTCSSPILSVLTHKHVIYIITYYSSAYMNMYSTWVMYGCRFCIGQGQDHSTWIWDYYITREFMVSSRYEDAICNYVHEWAMMKILYLISFNTRFLKHNALSINMFKYLSWVVSK